MTEQDFLNSVIKSSTPAWFETHARIWGKDRSVGLIRPRQNYLQKKIGDVADRMRELNLPVRLIILKPRQKGSTTYAAAETYCSLRRQSASGVVIAGQYSQSSEVHEMLKTYQTNDNFSWGSTGEINSKEGRWTNGSRLKFETAGDVLAGVSGTFQTIHSTEVARWSRFGVANASDVLANILKCCPMLPGTMILLESTAEGAAGAFYERWVTAIDAEDFLSGKSICQPGSYIRCFAPWYEFTDSAMRLTEEQQEEIKNTLDSEDEFAGENDLVQLYGRDDGGVLRLGTAVDDFTAYEALAWRRWAIREECKRDKIIFSRDYPSSWETAFQKSGSMRFNASGLVVQRQRLAKRALPQYGVIEGDAKGAFRNTEKSEAKIIVFEKPIPGRKYIVAVDPATGASQTGGADPDRHGVFVLRAGYWASDGQWVRPATAARIVQNMFDPDVLEVEIWRLARMYGSRSGAKIVVETNMDRGLIELLKLRGADLYQRELFNKREYKTTTALGYQTTSKTKEILIDTLAAAIREWDKPGSGIDIWCPEAIIQCENFIVKPNGRSQAAENHHDDDVIAIALGLELIDQATTYTPDRSGPMSHEMSLMHPSSPAGGAPSAYS